VRIDKIRLAGLAATLIHYVKEEAERKIPIWQMISAPLAEIEGRAERWGQRFAGLATLVDGESLVGGGSLPGSTLPTKLVAIKAPGKGKGPSMVQRLAAELRAQQPPVIARIEGNCLLLDPRTVPPEEDEILLAALHSAVRGLGIG
jgi:L-seryl-tRNA(Ser) seleniumtransferase